MTWLFSFIGAITIWYAYTGIAWVIKNGWRSMLGLAEKRDEAIADAMSCGCERNGQPQWGCMRCPGEVRCTEHKDQHQHNDRHSWDSHNADAVLLTHEKRDDEESNEAAADFVLWTFECDADEGIRKYARRMDRWSS